MKKIILVCCVILNTIILLGQDPNGNSMVKKNKKNGGWVFTTVKEVNNTSVKNQFKSGTCWTYSGQSFLESELMRAGKGTFDLSEMFIVREAYSLKAEKYLRFGGNCSFGAGGQFHDVMYVMNEYGIVPQEVYSGFINGESKPEHGEMDAVIKSMMDAALKLPDGKLSPALRKSVEATLDNYLGQTPKEFTYKGKKYTPKSFQSEMGLNPEDYVEVTSFSHHPFYKQFSLEVPDNWSNTLGYNVPVDDLQAIMDNAIANNYSAAWASDVSEKTFSFKNGVAFVPELEWSEMPKIEQDSIFTKPPMKERKITQEVRQKSYDNLSTTDDHGMHIVGSAKDQNGNPYYIVKNSWGTEGNDLNGYFYASVPYFKFKTTAILVNKKAIPKDIAKKMGLI